MKFTLFDGMCQLRLEDEALLLASPNNVPSLVGLTRGGFYRRALMAAVAN